MYIRNDIDLQDFFKKIAFCSGAIYFDTKEGDHLNLKSQFSQLILSILYSKNNALSWGTISFEKESDYSVLKGFLE